MTRKKSILAVLLVLLLGAVGAGLYRYHTQRFVPKRQNEDQIIVYQDCNKVELFFHNPEDAAPVEIRVEVYIGDGPYEAARAQVQSGETVTLLETIDGKPFRYFVPGIFGGRILVYDLESGRLKDRIDPLEFRIYQSHRDAYDVLGSSEEHEREVHVDEKEHRPERLNMQVDLKTEQIRSGFYGLFAEWRNLNTYIYAQIDGKEVLVSKAENIPPRTLIFDLYLEPGVADLLEVGDTVADVRVDSYYADTGEFYDSIPGEIYEVIRTD